MLQRQDLRRDLIALRRHLWFTLAAVAVALVAAGAWGMARGSPDEAQFRLRVEATALPPLFGPPTLPTAPDFAAFAISEQVVGATSQRLQDQGVPGADSLAGRLSAVPRANQPAIDFTVRGEQALAVAEAWRSAFRDLLPLALPELERQVTADYAQQLDHARNELLSRQAEAASGELGSDLALAAARENYQVASRLSQSYEVVGQTMRAQVQEQVAPHRTGGGALDWAARLGAALAFGLVVGVLGAVALEAQARRRVPAAEPRPAPAYERTSPP